MKLTIQRHGGFAGTSETLAVKDSTGLAPDASVAFRAMVDRIRSLSQEHHPVGADFVRYELRIDEPGAQATVSFADDGSDKARQLVELVNTISAL
jgi:hypothetical protein